MRHPPRKVSAKRAQKRSLAFGFARLRVVGRGRQPSARTAHRMMLLPASLLAAAFCLRPPVGLRARTSTIAASASFDDLRALDNKIEKLSSMGISGLRSFYDDSTRCFALTPGKPRVSVTSTVFSLLAIDAAPNAWRASRWPTTRIKGCLSALLEADWRENDVYAQALTDRPRLVRSHTHARSTRAAHSFQAVLVVVALRLIDPEASLVRGDASFARGSNRRSAPCSSRGQNASSVVCSRSLPTCASGSPPPALCSSTLTLTMWSPFSRLSSPRRRCRSTRRAVHE